MHKNVLNDAGGSPISGVATLALFPNQKVLLNVIFRNGTRSWEVELPRGGKNKNETSEETACREVQEETGYEINGLVLLGQIPHLSGSMTNLTVVY